MKFVRNILDSAGEWFKPGKKLAKLYPLYEAVDTFAYTPGRMTRRAPFVRDHADLKRVMVFVVFALLPCLAMGIYNTGLQMLIGQGEPVEFTRAVWLGLTKVIPLMIVIYAVGGFWEVLFAVVRRHEVNEGFFVTGMLFTLIMPPTLPLWQAAVAISFGVVIGKEIFGGTGYNIMNPALVGRAFAFFAYPAQFSGDMVYVAVDGYSKATPLAVVADAARGSSAVSALQEAGYSLQDMFLGFIPGVIGETSTLACLLGLAFLLITGIASWRIITACGLGLVSAAGMFYLLKGPETLAFFSLPPHWHLVMGGFAFGAIFMATDPVSAAATNTGRWIYGFLIGVLVVLIRVVNPAYPEGVMLAILFMNVFAPLIDHFVVEAHVRRRTRRIEERIVNGEWKIENNE
ncbi:MAG: NADH:ubiquinone reductase (Na(+)-transporting) subunit B [Candidatus Omnitrophota bacterium]